MSSVEKKIESLQQEEPALQWCGAFLASHPDAELYLVGGSIRDAMLGRDNKDFDFVVRGLTAAEIERWLSKHGRVDLTGRTFGVFKYLPEGLMAGEHAFIDIALPRSERASADSLGGYRDFEMQSDPSLPIETDLSRRDFTINAMAYELRAKRLIDPFGGARDLAGKIIRAVGTPVDRFAEDLSRLLRAIRFAVQLQLEIEPTTWQALKDHIKHINQKRQRVSTPARESGGSEEFVVPRETVGRELAKTLVSDPVRAVRLLCEAGAMDLLLPGLDVCLEIKNYLAPLSSYPAELLSVTLAILLRGLPPDDVRRRLRESGLSSLPRESSMRADPDEIAWIVSRLQDPDAVRQSVEARASVFEREFMSPRGERFLRTLQALGASAVAEAARTRATEISTRWDVSEHDAIPQLISGADALTLGVPPSPRIRELLNLVRDAQLEGTVKTRTEALETLRNLVRTR